MTAFDPEDETQRNRVIRTCVEASLEDLAAGTLARLGELAVFPEEENAPLDVVEALWAETGGLEDDEADALIQRFDALSLLQSLRRGARTLRLHDNMIWYLRDRIGPEGYRAASAAMVRALSARCDAGWAKLPASHAYGWRFLIRHLRAAGQDQEADALLVDYDWIRAKLRATGASDLFGDYLPESPDEFARLVGRAIRLSLPALTANPRELPRQLFGRIGNLDHEAARAIVAAAKRDPDFSPRPRWPGLTPPGAERLRLVGHENFVMSAAFSPDGARIVTACWDKTARVWDAATGKEIAVLRGHENYVTTAAFSPDGARIVTGSHDRTARIWDASTGKEFATLLGHEDAVKSAAFSPDGARIVTASFRDATARIWDAATRQEIATLLGHEDAVKSATFSPDGARVVTGSYDRTARIWDASTGREIAVLRGRENMMEYVVFSPDGTRIITVPETDTARVWDAATGQEIAALRGHAGRVRSAAFSPDGALTVTGSDDGTAQIWDAVTGQKIAALRGHEGGVWSAAFSPDGARIVTASSDRTARIWDAMAGQEIADLLGRESWVMSAAFSPDIARVVAHSHDGTTRIWNACTGQKIADLRSGDVTSASFSPDSSQIVIAAGDTARICDVVTGQEIVTLA